MLVSHGQMFGWCYFSRFFEKSVKIIFCRSAVRLRYDGMRKFSNYSDLGKTKKKYLINCLHGWNALECNVSIFR